MRGCHGTHLVAADMVLAHAQTITPTLYQFLETKFLFWLGILSILGAAKNAVKALQVATDWLKVVEFLYFMSYPKSLKLDPGITSA